MAVNYGMSLINELKTVLAQRKKILEIFGTYKEMYWDLLNLLATSYGTDIDTAVSAFYLANYVMNFTQDTETVERIIDDDERVKIVLKNLLEARRRLSIDFESLIHLYTLIYEWADRIEKDLVQQARLLVKKKVITTNLVDVYAIPLFSSIQNAIPQLDLRWAMAELAGGLNRRFATSLFENILQKYPIEAMKPIFYFDAGFYIIDKYVEKYFDQKFNEKDYFKQLEVFGDIGRQKYDSACSAFYKTKSKDLYIDLAYDDQLTSNLYLEEEIKKVLQINSTDNPYNLLFAKFYVKIKNSDTGSAEKFFYIHNYEEKEQSNLYSESIGTMNYFLLTSEDLNLKSINSYATQRCIDIRGIKNRLDQGKCDTSYIKNLLSAWMEMYIHNLQEEYNFLEMPDELREQGFIPVGLIRQEKNNDSMQMLLDVVKSITAKRMKTLGIKTSSLTLDQTLWIITHLKTIIDHTANIIKLILEQQNTISEISIYPQEFLLEHPQLEKRNILIMFSVDESNIVGLISQNETALEFQTKSLKRRQILSKTHQLLTDIRIKTLTDARSAKLDAYIRDNVEEHFNPGKFLLEIKINTNFSDKSV